MAGSYKHVITRSGNLKGPAALSNSIENIGDATEAIQEMFGMIWHLAGRTKDPKAAVAKAEAEYEKGYEIAKKANRKAKS